MANDGVKVERIQAGRPWPLDFKLEATQYEAIGKLIVKAIVRNVRGQKTATGLAQKENDPSTKKRKQKKRGHTLSLVDDPTEHRFSRQGRYEIETDSDGVTVYPNDLKVSGYVQEKGYVGWMAPDAEGFTAIRGAINQVIKQAQRKAAKFKKKVKSGG